MTSHENQEYQNDPLLLNQYQNLFAAFKTINRGIFVPHLLKLAPLTTLKQAYKAEIVYTLSLHLCNYNSIYIYDNPCSPAVLLSKK